MKKLLIRLINRCGLYTEAQLEEEIDSTWTAATHKGQWTKDMWVRFLWSLRHKKIDLMP